MKWGKREHDRETCCCFYRFTISRRTIQPQPNHTTKAQSAIISSLNIVSSQKKSNWTKKYKVDLEGASGMNFHCGKMENISIVLKDVMVHTWKGNAIHTDSNGTKPCLPLTQHDTGIVLNTESLIGLWIIFRILVYPTIKVWAKGKRGQTGTMLLRQFHGTWT